MSVPNFEKVDCRNVILKFLSTFHISERKEAAGRAETRVYFCILSQKYPNRLQILGSRGGNKSDPIRWCDSLFFLLKSGREGTFLYFSNNNTICRAHFEPIWAHFDILTQSLRFVRVVFRNITKFCDFQKSCF